MGRQINFFATFADMEPLISKLYEKDIVVINEYGRIIGRQEAPELFNKATKQDSIYITRDYFHKAYIPFGPEKIPIIDVMKSEVIEFFSSYPKTDINATPDCIDYSYYPGRFWYSRDYLDIEQMIIRYKTNDAELGKIYDMIVRYIRKNFKYSSKWQYYIGSDAYQKMQNGLFIPYSGKYRIDFD